MNKIKYLIKRLHTLDYSNMIKIAKSISKKNRKFFLFIFIDMIYCGIVFQAGYYDYQEFEFYNLNNKQRKTYLTRGKNSQIIKAFNNKDYIYLFEDKVEFNKVFSNYITHAWLYIQNDNISEFIDFFKRYKSIIVKPIDLSGGKLVEKYDFVNDEHSKELYEKLIKNKQFLIEECIKQHSEMSRLYSKSVNTLRMFTFIKDGTPSFLQALLKIGNGNVVDNFSSGGMYTYVDEGGKVIVPAIDQADNIYYNHPISNTKIVDFKVPMFDKAVELVRSCSKIVPQVAYVGWDVAITENGPELIEGNCYPGVFQVKPSLSNKKEGLLPKYAEIMGIKL